MENYTLVCSRTVNNTIVDGYYNDKNAWFTRNQIGEALEYEFPVESIGRIHNRHKNRLDLFSRVSQLDLPSGKQQGYVYNLRGVLEICRWSKQPKANMVMDALYDMAEEVMEKGYYSRLPDKVLLRMLVQRCKESEVFLNSFDKAKLRQQVLISNRQDRIRAANELYERRYSLTKTEYRKELNDICRHDNELYMKMLEKYEKEENFLEMYQWYKDGNITVAQACMELSISGATWRKKIKELEAV